MILKILSFYCHFIITLLSTCYLIILIVLLLYYHIIITLLSHYYHFITLSSRYRHIVTSSHYYHIIFMILITLYYLFSSDCGSHGFQPNRHAVVHGNKVSAASDASAVSAVNISLSRFMQSLSRYYHAIIDCIMQYCRLITRFIFDNA